jgi:hypothetical protein
MNQLDDLTKGGAAEPVARTTRRRLVQSAALAAAGLAAGRLASPLVTTHAAADPGVGADAHGFGTTILQFTTMAGIQSPFLGDAGLAAFRGVHGGTGPWVLRQASGFLTLEGLLVVRVRGLVLDPRFVPAPNGGTNPVPSFMAIVSGFSTDPVQPVNLQMGLFPASRSGDAEIVTRLNLPHPFFAPIVFVTSLPLSLAPGAPAAPRWFAVSGQQ